MQITRNPAIIIQQFIAVFAVIIFPIAFLVIRQSFIQDYAFIVIYIISCFVGLICSFVLLFIYELPKYAFPGIAIHLFALFLITCY